MKKVTSAKVKMFDIDEWEKKYPNNKPLHESQNQESKVVRIKTPHLDGQNWRTPMTVSYKRAA